MAIGCCFFTYIALAFLCRMVMLLWHILNTISIPLRRLNGAHMNLLHWQFHHRIINWRRISLYATIFGCFCSLTIIAFIFGSNTDPLFNLEQNMGPFFRERRGRGGWIQGKNRRESGCPCGSASTTSFCSPGYIFLLILRDVCFYPVQYAKQQILLLTGPERLERTALAHTNSRNAHLYCCRWF